LSNYISSINGPDDLTLLQWELNNNEIYDKDGDGVEDNIAFHHDELDEFYQPAVFGDVEDLYNTHHGNMPGHVQKEFDKLETEPEQDHYSLVQADWIRK
jgi:hypothetical protein